LTDIDRAKGLAIILVVLGHLIADEYPPHNEWYYHLERIIYSFHMAFFMFLTGVVMFYTYPQIHTLRDYGAYVKKKFGRLVPAYLLMALVIALGKTVAGWYAKIENPVNGLADLVDVLVRPTQSYCGSVWYVYVVFIYFVTIPLLLVLFRRSLGALLLLAIAVYFVPRSNYFAQSQICEYLFVFLLGVYACRHYDAYLDLIDRKSWLFITAFGMCVCLHFVVHVPKLLFGLAAIPALHSTVRTRWAQKAHLLKLAGDYVFPIYLLNTLTIGVCRVLVQKYWSWDGPRFLVVAPILFASGLFLPIVMYELFIKRIPVLRSIIRK